MSRPERRAAALSGDAWAPLLGDRVREGLLDRRDQLFIDAGINGELLVARVRIVLLLMLFLIQLIPGGDRPTMYVAMPLNGFALLVALIFYALATRETRPWLGFLSSGADVTLVSLGLVGFLFLGHPHNTVSSRDLFDVYFLALGCASLRYNWRVCVLTGVLAVSQYAAIVWFTASHWNVNDPARHVLFAAGAFDWSVQGAALILLAAAAVLARSS